MEICHFSEPGTEGRDSRLGGVLLGCLALQGCSWEGGREGNQGEHQRQSLEAKLRSWRERERTEQDSSVDRLRHWDFQGRSPGRQAGRQRPRMPGRAMASCHLLKVWTVVRGELNLQGRDA